MAHQIDGTPQAVAEWPAAMIVNADWPTRTGRRGLADADWPTRTGTTRGLFGRLHIGVHVLFGQPALCL
jgi:hypothetical protein